MAKPSKADIPKYLAWGGGFVAFLLLALMLVAAGQMILGVNDPPLQSDPAPTTSPVLYCDGVAVTPTAVSTTTTGPNAPASGTSTSSTGGRCQGTLAYGPQLRGAYDPDARLTGLMSIVVPLITTIVAFFFGQHAGMSQAQGAIKDKNAMDQAIRTEANGANSAQAVMSQLVSQGVMK
jgi:hypothetical protein